MATLRNMIVGDKGSMIVLSLQPPGAHRSYVEDVAMVREQHIDYAGYLDDAAAEEDVEDMFRQSRALAGSKASPGRDGLFAEASSGRDGLFGWMGGICFGSRSELALL